MDSFLMKTEYGDNAILMDILQLLDGEVLERTFPEALWFVIAIVSIFSFLYMFHKYISNQEEMMKELKEMASDHDKTLVGHDTRITAIENNRLSNLEDSINRIEDKIFNVKYNRGK